jgi:hypothetical protein
VTAVDTWAVAHNPMVRRNHRLEGIAGIAADLNAVWPRMPAARAASASGLHPCPHGHKDVRVRPSGWVVCFVCMTVLYRAAAPSAVRQLVAAMEVSP